MRWRSFPILVFAFASLACQSAFAAPPVFGSVVSIGGTAADIALDETHGVLYVADFDGFAIDVISLANNTLLQSYSAIPYPGSIAVSPGGQYLMIAHYGNGTSTPQGTNAVSVITIASNSRQVYNTTDPPLAVAFLGNGQGIVVTTTSVLIMDPASGNTTQLGTFSNLAMALPVPLATFPGQILQAALATSADGNTVWGIGSADTGIQMIYRYNAPSNTLEAETYTSSPATLPRISSAADGSAAMAGYSLINAAGYIQGRYPQVQSSTNITGVALDTVHGYIYGQFPDTFQPTGPPGSSGGTVLPSLVVLDSDNLTYRDRFFMPEDMVGRALLNSAGTVLYAVSESGVMILPIGSLNNYHRLVTGQEDVLVATSYCNGGVLKQSFTISDPSGGQTDFTITPSQAGVTISPSSGTTPATVQVQVDPELFPAGGTTTVMLNISSHTAVNAPAPVRLLVNKPDPSQRGTIVDQPGVLTDILPDPARNRFYVLRQDRNKLYVFDGPTQSLVATLRTGTTPNMMSFTPDQNYLLVANDNAQFVSVFDLNALAPSTPIILPGGLYARSIAQSSSATLALVRNEGPTTPLGCAGTGCIVGIDFANRAAAALTTLGVYSNSVSPTAALATSPGGGYIFLAAPDGNVLLYSAAANTFVASRQDFSSLSGGLAASDFGTYVVGNTTFDSSLVPSGTISLPSGTGSGFSFTGQGGYLASAVASSSAGNLQFLPSLQAQPTSSVTMVEAPVLPSTPPVAWPPSVVSAAQTSFTRTIAQLPASNVVVVMTTSGFTVMAPSYPIVPPPTVAALVSAADGNPSVAPGEWVSVYGQNLSSTTLGTGQVPLPTDLANVCVSANGAPIPLLFVSSGQINAQLPYSLSGTATLNVHTPSGVSANYSFSVQPAAPSVFMSGAAGPETGLATIFRDDDNQLVTPTNPIHPKDYITIFLTGMGQTSPPVVEGQAAPVNPLAQTILQPGVTLGDVSLTVTFAGLVPGEVGVYQINAYVPTGLSGGLAVPLVINQGSLATTLYVRVVTN